MTKGVSAVMPSTVITSSLEMEAREASWHWQPPSASPE